MTASTPPPARSRREPASDREAIDDRLVKALSHPLRQRILAILNERTSSPREVAEQLGEKLGDVGYHVRRLREYGAIELVRTEQRRGAIKHYYRATTRAMLDDDQWRRLPASARRTIFGEALEQVLAHVAEAAGAGGFDRPDAQVSWTRFELDERGYRQMTKLAEQTLRKAQEIQAAAQERRAAGRSDGHVTTELVLLHFLPDGEAAAA